MYETSLGSREKLVDTSTGWDINKDDKLFGWIEYNIAESDKEDLFGEKGKHEVYVPGIVRSEKLEQNYFMPVIWDEERDDIEEKVKEQTGVSPVKWRAKSAYYTGNGVTPNRDPANEAFDITLMENDIELETGFDKETGVEKWPETGAVRVSDGDNTQVYGYVKEFTKDPATGIDIEAEIAGVLEPYGVLEEPDENRLEEVEEEIVKVDDDIESYENVKFDGTYLPE